MLPTSKNLEADCKKTVEHFKKEITGFRTGRASASLLENIMVDYYGSMVPIMQLGQINVPEPRMLTVQVYDAGAVDAIDKAIRNADLGLNPSREGNLVRVSIPSLTEERRKELAKKLHKMAEDNRVGIRNHRRDALEAVKKAKKDGLPEDDAKKEDKIIEEIVGKYIKEIDAAMAVKEKELLEV